MIFRNLAALFSSVLFSLVCALSCAEPGILQPTPTPGPAQPTVFGGSFSGPVTGGSFTHSKPAAGSMGIGKPQAGSMPSGKPSGGSFAYGSATPLMVGGPIVVETTDTYPRNERRRTRRSQR